MASIKYKTNEGYVSIPLNIIGSRVYLEDYDDGEVIPELVDDNAKLGNGIGTCSTSSGTALEVTLDNYRLVKNGIIAVTFENDVPANATLNINNKGAKAIYNEGSAIEADVIKAGKTVMFAYDGTNYVVTSLGGGGGTIVWPEFVTIQLTQSGGSDSDLIGATVVVTNDDTSATILSTTWQGNDFTVKVDANTNYTISVGEITDYIINVKEQSYVSIEGYNRKVLFTYVGGFVDLGLPSGILWGTKDIGSLTPEGKGLLFSWGNIQGHYFDDSYSFSSQNYSSTVGSTLTASYRSGDENYDAAAYNIGGGARTPTLQDYQELIAGTTKTKVTINNVLCIKFQSKSNDAYILLPTHGGKDGTNNIYPERAFHWIATYYNSSEEYHTNFVSDSLNLMLATMPRYVGEPIRPVM